MDPDVLERRLQADLDALPQGRSRRTSPRPDAPRPRAGRADRGVLVLPAEPIVRRAADRRRGGQGRPGGARRDAEGVE